MEFNSEKLYLGSLCKRGHRWQGTEQSLRRKDNCNCIECTKVLAKTEKRRKKRNEYTKKYREKNRESYLANRRARYRENIEESREKHREYYRNNEKVKARRSAYKRTEKYREYERAYRRKNAERLKEYRKNYTQSNKERISKRHEKYREENREEIRKRGREYSRKNRAKNREYDRKHRAENRELYREKNRRRRAKMKEVSLVDFKPSEIKTRFVAFDNSCAYCGSKDRITADHFISINKGGGHCIGNIVPACLSCNSGKRDRDPWEWYEQQPFYSKNQWEKILNILGKKNPNQLPLF